MAAPRKWSSPKRVALFSRVTEQLRGGTFCTETCDLGKSHELDGGLLPKPLLQVLFGRNPVFGVSFLGEALGPNLVLFGPI